MIANADIDPKHYSRQQLDGYQLCGDRNTQRVTVMDVEQIGEIGKRCVVANKLRYRHNGAIFWMMTQ